LIFVGVGKLILMLPGLLSFPAVGLMGCGPATKTARPA
jgi:hypothetical protein